MKKILSSLLIATMMLSMVAMSTSAADAGILWTANFSSQEAWATSLGAEDPAASPGGLFVVDDENPGVAVGNKDARALQSHSIDTDEDGFSDDGLVFGQQDIQYEVSFAADGDTRDFGITYINYNRQWNGDADDGQFLTLTYDWDYGTVALTSAFGVDLSTENQTPDPEGDPLANDYYKVLTTPVEYEIVDGEKYVFGLSVTAGKIRGFINGTLVAEFQDDVTIEGVNYDIGGEIPTLLFAWNTGNLVTISRLQVATPGYFYPEGPAPDTDAPATDAPATDAPATDAPATDAPATDAPATDAPATDAPATDAPATDAPETTEGTQAPTNTNAPDNNDNAQTGDISFIVVAAMVVALGSAIIVKKVSAK